MREVTLSDMLAAREQRAAAQQALLRQYSCPVVSFSMNIAGSLKDDPLIRRAFSEGCRLLENALAQSAHPVLLRRIKRAFTGCEALYAVQGDPVAIKRLCVEVEDSLPLGRLFDMDVIAPNGNRPDRRALGLPERNCLVCGQSGRECASRRAHPVDEVRAAARRLMEQHFAQADRSHIGALATEALYSEVHATPKPGLVDRRNSGSHRDMDFSTFLASIEVLKPYWTECVAIGQSSAAKSAESTFLMLRAAGIEAESRMLEATHGVNTHRGAIFSLGVLCGAAGRLWHAETPCRDPNALACECARMTSTILRSDLNAIRSSGVAATHGQQLYLRYGIEGVRGEMLRGLPGALNIALPALRTALKDGRSRNDACVIALLHLIARTEDTNMVARGGRDAARVAADSVAALLDANPSPSMEAVAALDDAFIARNLSPGGCADLLAIACFLHDLEETEAFLPSALTCGRDCDMFV